MPKRKPSVIRCTPLNYNAMAQKKYAAAIKALVAEMTRTVTRDVKRLMNSEVAEEYFAADASVSSRAKQLMDKLQSRFSQLFDEKASPFAKRMVDGANKQSKSGLKDSLRKVSEDVTLKFTVGAEMEQAMQAMVEENVGLIKSIANKYLEQVQGAVMRSITTGNGLADLVPALEKYNGMTERRAELVALDQTRKAYSGINKIRMQNSGLRKFEWLHTAGSQHPRKYHEDVLNGNIYSLDDPPVIDPNTGERGIPGQLPYCRCRMVPVIEFEGEDDK